MPLYDRDKSCFCRLTAFGVESLGIKHWDVKRLWLESQVIKDLTGFYTLCLCAVITLAILSGWEKMHQYLFCPQSTGTENGNLLTIIQSATSWNFFFCSVYAGSCGFLLVRNSPFKPKARARPSWERTEQHQWVCLLQISTKCHEHEQNVDSGERLIASCHTWQFLNTLAKILAIHKTSCSFFNHCAHWYRTARASRPSSSSLLNVKMFNQVTSFVGRCFSCRSFQSKLWSSN